MGGRLRSLTAPAPGQAWTASGRLWRCPACAKEFVQRGLWHSCTVVSLDEHFRERARARVLFDAFRAAVDEAGGPVRLSIAKTRIGFITTITFAAVEPRKAHLRAGFLLLRKVDSPRFVRIAHFPPYWLHSLDIRDEAEIDADVKGWLREAYEVGKGRRRATAPGTTPGPSRPGRPRSRRR